MDADFEFPNSQIPIRIERESPKSLGDSLRRIEADIGEVAGRPSGRFHTPVSRYLPGLAFHSK
jgi:hypothetical protein